MTYLHVFRSQAEKIQLNLKIEDATKPEYSTSVSLKGKGIVCCGECGYLQNVERTYCKKCDNYLKLD
jgi:hypothetical protein